MYSVSCEQVGRGIYQYLSASLRGRLINIDGMKWDGRQVLRNMISLKKRRKEREAYRAALDGELYGETSNLERLTVMATISKTHSTQTFRF